MKKCLACKPACGVEYSPCCSAHESDHTCLDVRKEAQVTFDSEAIIFARETLDKLTSEQLAYVVSVLASHSHQVRKDIPSVTRDMDSVVARYIALDSIVDILNETIATKNPL